MDVVLFSTSNCPRCKVIKAGLDKWGVDYKVIEDDEAINLGVTSFPTLEVNGNRMSHPDAYRFLQDKTRGTIV